MKVCDPSGGHSSAEPIEERGYDVAGGPGYLTWHWSNVYTENNVLIYPVQASPAPLAMYGNTPLSRGRPPRGAGRPVDYWTSASAEIQSHLPITLGTGAEAVDVGTLQSALSHLDGRGGAKAGRCRSATFRRATQGTPS